MLIARISQTLNSSRNHPNSTAGVPRILLRPTVFKIKVAFVQADFKLSQSPPSLAASLILVAPTFDPPPTSLALNIGELAQAILSSSLDAFNILGLVSASHTTWHKAVIPSK
jgi:hypothetical protein